MRKFIFILLYFFTANAGLYADKLLGYQKALSKYILNLSESDYKSYKQKNIILKKYKGWRKIIDRSFFRLSHFSGFITTKIDYAIIKNRHFNAFSYPGGQFIIHTGTLDEIDKEIDKKNKNGTERDIERELYISGILAHELAHYYNKHTFLFYMKRFSFKKESNKNSIKLITFGQDLELDADRTAYILLGKADYDKSYFLKVLKLLNQKHQKNLKNYNINPYFSSHPSPNRRLGKLSKTEKKFYKLADKMETSFADIQLGTNLENALNEVENGLVYYKDNLDLLRAKAVALHKLWLESASMPEIHLRSIIELPSFRNDMIIKKNASKDIRKKIPGNIRLYKKARRTYRRLVKQLKDPYLLANYASLLAYSPNPKKERKAEKYAIRAYKESDGSLIIGNNLGVVLYLIGKKKSALEIFEALASRSHTKIKNLLENKNKTAKKKIAKIIQEIKRKQSFNQRFVNKNLTPILNLALIHYYLNPKSKNAKLITSLYLKYDKKSEWAKFLAQRMHMQKYLKKSKYMIKMKARIHGVELGNNFKQVFEKWGSYTRIKSFGKKTYYYYDKQNTKIEFYDTQVTNIELSSGAKFKINRRIGIDMEEDKFKSYFKTYAGVEGNYKTYMTNTGSITTYSQDGVVRKLWLYKK